MDLAVGIYVTEKNQIEEETEFQKVWNKLFPSVRQMRKRIEYTTIYTEKSIIQCLHCQGSVDLWDTEKKACPCCEGTMSISNNGVIIYWD